MKNGVAPPVVSASRSRAGRRAESRRESTRRVVPALGGVVATKASPSAPFPTARGGTSVTPQRAAVRRSGVSRLAALGSDAAPRLASPHRRRAPLTPSR